MSAKLTDKKSIPAVIKEMTLEEKAALVTGESPFCTHGLERLGIPPALLLDGGTGINFMQLYIEKIYRIDKRKNHKDGSSDVTGLEGFAPGVRIVHGKPDSFSREEQETLREATDEVNAMKPHGKAPGCYPPGMMLGATWDPETVYSTGEALGREASAFGVDVLLGSPNVNIHRDPLNGRLFEGYSEDPCLVSKLAPSFVKGIQDQGVVADVKHFAANNQETERMGVNEHIPERALQEIYFPGFRACVKDSGVRTVMSAYNKINGKACAMNRWLLNDVLRGQWGFSGFVMSDWGAAYDQVEAAEAGNDLVMSGPRCITPLVDAVKSGRISESVLDECVANFLGVLLEMPVMKGRRYTDIDTDISLKAAYRAAAEGIVLLKNNRGTLPLDKNRKMSLFGEKSKKFIESGGGSAVVWTDLSTNLFDSVVQEIGANAVTFGTINGDTDTVVITAGAQGQEGLDRPAMDIDADDREMLLNAVAQAKAMKKKTVVVLNVSGPVQMADWIDDVDAVLCVFFPGMEGGHATADILFGNLNPSGKLPITFPKCYSDCPTYGNFPGENSEVWYGEGIYVGYRYYDFKHVEPLYPFGYGLSYTSFNLSRIRTEPSVFNLDDGGKVKVFVMVKNAGKTAGKEVVQLYIADEVSTLNKPPKELKAFKKVYLEPGEEKEICFELGKGDLASYDTYLNEWTTEPGYYQVLVGNSSRNITLKDRFKAVGDNPYGYGPNSTIVRICKDSRAVDVIRNRLAEFKIEPLNVVGSDLAFYPTKRFSIIWEKSFAPLFTDKTESEKNGIRDEIYKELKKIDVSRE